VLELKNITKYFNSNLVLDNISFTVPKGEIFGLIGPNGAGKTTTLRIILGILTLSDGKIFFNNNLLNQNYSNITGYLPEERGLYPKSNVINTLAYLGQLKGLKYSEVIEKINYWLNRLDMLEYSKYHIEELSKGNQQKVQFISAILHDPKILILDEPFSGFDPVNQSIFREIIEEYKQDKFIILSTHLMDLAESLCDEIFLIDRGKEIFSGKMKNIINSEERTSYEVSFLENLNEEQFDSIKMFNPVRKSKNSVYLKNSIKNPTEIIKELSRNFEITEFKKNVPSLNQIFLSLVDKSS